VSAVRLTLVGKPECHLCDDARDAVAQVISRLGAEASAVTVEELSILDDADLHKRYWDEIPVLLINGRVHTIWRVDPARLTLALRDATA
jgi:hypothetical protein